MVKIVRGISWFMLATGVLFGVLSYVASKYSIPINISINGSDIGTWMKELSINSNFIWYAIGIPVAILLWWKKSGKAENIFVGTAIFLIALGLGWYYSESAELGWDRKAVLLKVNPGFGTPAPAPPTPADTRLAAAKGSPIVHPCDGTNGLFKLKRGDSLKAASSGCQIMVTPTANAAGDGSIVMLMYANGTRILLASDDPPCSTFAGKPAGEIPSRCTTATLNQPLIQVMAGNDAWVYAAFCPPGKVAYKNGAPQVACTP